MAHGMPVKRRKSALVAEPGFEPGLTAPKAAVLPLHNSAVSGTEGRTRTDTGVAPHQFLRLTRLPFRHFGMSLKVPRGGIEPPARGFSVHCSTPELPRHAVFYCSWHVLECQHNIMMYAARRFHTHLMFISHTISLLAKNRACRNNGAHRVTSTVI